MLDPDLLLHHCYGEVILLITRMSHCLLPAIRIDHHSFIATAGSCGPPNSVKPFNEYTE